MPDPAIQTTKKLLSGDNAALFPKEVIADIWQRAYKGSLISQVSQTRPIPLSGAAVPVPVGRPTAGIVTEGSLKPVIDVSIGTKVMTPVKAAAIAILSMETIYQSPLAAFLSLREQLSDAIARAIDTAVIHGKDAITGAALPGHETLMATPNVVDIDFAATRPGVISDAFVQAMGMIDAADEDYGADAIIARPTLKAPILNAKDSTGRPLYVPEVDLSSPVAMFMGLPLYYRQTVGGVDKAKTEETALMAILGNFKGNLLLGNVEDMSLRVADQYAAGVDLFGRNLVAYLVEAQFGWAVRDTKAFTVLRKKA